MRKILVVLVFYSTTQLVFSESDSTKKNWQLGVLVDAYYGHFTGKSIDGHLPYLVSSALQNNFSVNLALLSAKISQAYYRGNLQLGVGSYMQANYEAEPIAWRNIVEANAGVILHKKRNIWLDAGVFVAPFTNETAISKDHIMYTRSLSVENSPYYVSGVRLEIPIVKKFKLFGYLVNGWQQISDVNDDKSGILQMEFKPNSSNTINWNIYAGNEKSSVHPEFRDRYFSDIWWEGKINNKWSGSAALYMGIQHKKDSFSNTYKHNWYSGNVSIRYTVNSTYTIGTRMEYFHDPEEIVQVIPTPIGGYSTFSGGICNNFTLSENTLLRFEWRHFRSPNKIYGGNHGHSNWKDWFIGNLTVWF